MMMNKTGLCLLALVLMASTIQMATASKVPTGTPTGANNGQPHPASEKAAAKVSGVRAKVSGIREHLTSKKNHSSSLKMDGGAL